MGRLGGLVALIVLLATLPAAGHGVLERTEPRADGTVSSPSQVRLWFSGALEPAYSRVRVEDAQGKRVDLRDGGVDAGDRALLRVSVPALAPGRYRVVWRVLSVDSHVTEGTFAFTVKG